MRLPERARPAWAWLVAHQPWSALVPLLAVQWLAVVALAVTVRHNGWLYYQGGDQTYYWTQSHLLTEWTLPVTAIGYGWSYLLTPIALFAGANVLSGLPVVLVLNVLVLLPIALLSVYGIAARIGGRYLGYWAAFLWVLIPYAAIPMFDQRYHQKYVEITLPQQLGLTVLGDFPSMVFLLATAYLLVRALDSRDWRDTALAGILGAFTIGIKPSNALFFGAALLCLLIARRWLQTGAFLAAMIPGLFILALWKQRGLGDLPAFASYGGNGSVAAAGVNFPFASLTSPFSRYLDLNWGHLHQNMDGVREFFWAVRPLEFIIPAGFLAIGRRSWPKAVLVAGWFATFFVIKGTADEASIEDASFFRLLMPSFPAFLLLLACIPLLVPSFGLARRLFVAAPPLRRKPGNRLLGGAVVALVLLPLILVAATSPLTKAEAINYPSQDVYIPVSKKFDLNAERTGQAVVLSWQAPYSGSTKIFYSVLRSAYKAEDPSSSGQRTAVEGLACRDRDNGGALLCNLYMDRVAPTTTLQYTDRPGEGKWTYRVAVSANWLNDPALGDLMSVSEPVTVKVP